MRSRKRQRFFTGVGIAVLIGSLLCIAFALRLFWGMQLQGSDFLFRAGYGQGQPAEEIVIVGIDDRSLEELGHLQSWSRSYHAQLIDLLAEAGARTIVFDMLFAEPAEGDEEMAASMRTAGNVLLPTVYASLGQGFTGAGQTETFGDFVRPLGVLEESAMAVGHANVLPDDDGVVRRLPIAVASGEECEPALALAAVAKYLRRPEIIESPIDGRTLSFAGRTVPLGDESEMLINYVAGSMDTGGAASFVTVSYVDVLGGYVEPGVFEDKIVIVGATATGIGDIFWTPTGHVMNGVDIHANAIHTILTGNFLRPASSGVTVGLVLVLALLCGVAVLRLRVLWATASAAFLMGAFFLLAFSSFDRGVMLNMVYPPMAIVGSFVGVNLYCIASERSEKKEITKTFGRYISPPVVEKILAALEKGDLKLGGDETEVTVAFADVRGFTRMTERIGPDELVRLLNRYLSIIIRAVLKYDGMVNKFGGDSIMAVWNAPTPCEDHALKAVMAAVEAQREIDAMQASDPDLPRIDFGIGINTGDAVAGNLGSENRFEYSVIGDPVNIAARLTAVAEGGKVWVGSGTYELVNSRAKVKELEPLFLKGKSEAVSAFEVIDICPGEQP